MIPTPSDLKLFIVTIPPSFVGGEFRKDTASLLSLLRDVWGSAGKTSRWKGWRLARSHSVCGTQAPAGQLATLGLPEDGGDFSPPKGQVQGWPSMSAPGFGQSRQSEAGPDSGGPSAPLSGPSAKPPLHVQARDGRLASSVPPRLWCWPFLLCRRPWAACGSAPPSSLAGLRGATERKDRLSALQGV